MSGQHTPIPMSSESDDFKRGVAMARAMPDVAEQLTSSEALAAGGPDFLGGDESAGSPDFHRGWDWAIKMARLTESQFRPRSHCQSYRRSQMTAAQVIWHPSTAEGCDRITARQRDANIAAEGQPVNVYTDPRVAAEMALYENYRTAKTVLCSPEWYGADVVHSALDFVREYESAIPKDPHATIRRRFVDGFDPDRPKPRDYGLLAVFAVLLLAAGVGWLTGMAAQMGWLG